ncbi:MAG: ribonuclease J [Clostridia bacterium]|nr:ribonuclease J [Clostridia bacterium]
MQNKTAKSQKNSNGAATQSKKNVKNAPQNTKKSAKNQNNTAEKKKKETKKSASAKNVPATQSRKQSRSSKSKKENPEISARSAAKNVRITFLGGINEIGKNLTVFEYNGEMIILDCGMTFPDADMPGIDYVLPDFNFIERNSDRIKAVFITHGHEDHIGGLPYLLKIVNVPVYASALTVGLIQGKLKEHRMLSSAKLKTIKPGTVTQAGPFTVEAIHVNHSIPDSLGFAIRSPAGVIVHTGDFKIDNTPIDGGVIDLARFASLGNEGVLCLMQDSTNAEKPGYTPSEKEVGKTLEQLFARAGKKRILVASFASNIHRIQQIVDASVKMKRKIFLSGRSLENVTAVSRELGFLNVPDGILVSIENLKNYRDEDIVLITTGSQGEPMSALTRMATGEHRKVTIGCNDFVIISATPIPGNEKTVANTINELMKLGAEVIYEKSLGIHVSGHAAGEELKLILNLVKPRYFIPVHGEQKHMRRHAFLAESVGISSKNIHVPELGEVVEVGESGIRAAAHVPAGRIFVDGSGVGDVGSAVLRDRKKLSTDGVVLITAVSDAYTGGLMMPVEIQTKGFVFTDNANELSSYISDCCEDVFDRYRRGVDMDVNALKQRLKDSVARVIFDRTKRTPVIIVSVFAV